MHTTSVCVVLLLFLLIVDVDAEMLIALRRVGSFSVCFLRPHFGV